MLSALKFVQGAVSKKDYQPALKHFRIKDGRVTGYNGIIALSSPIDLDISATPRALPFVKAIERCTVETTVIHVTPGGRLGVRSGGFKCFVECTDDSEVLDAIVPEGDDIQFAPNLLAALQALEPFVGNDASRPWATGVLLRGASAYATNNVIIAEYWLGEYLPVEVNLPSAAVDELLRIKEVPTRVQLSENCVTFHFEGGRWMRAQLLGLEWPDVSVFLDVATDALQPIPQGLFEAIETLAPFIGEEGRLYFRDGVLTTSPEDGAGASIDVPGLPERGAYHYKMLPLLNGVAETIDFTPHPKQCPFRGPMLRGVIQGMIDG